MLLSHILLLYYCYIIVILQVTCLSHEDQQKEQQKYGIFFKDEYNYLQHLKEPSSTQPVVLDVKDKVYSKDILFVYYSIFACLLHLRLVRVDKLIAMYHHLNT